MPGYSVPEKLIVSCPFHACALRTYFDLLDEHAERLIDPVLGRVHNNFLETGFTHVWAACPKRTKMSACYFRLMASLGLIHSNQTAMRNVCLKMLFYTHITIIHQSLTYHTRYWEKTTVPWQKSVGVWGCNASPKLNCLNARATKSDTSSSKK